MAVDNLGFQTVWRISISERPTPEWIQLFGQQQDATMLCKPTLVSFHRAGILFTSDAARLSTWVKYLDKWTRATNVAVAAAHERRRQEALAQTAVWKGLVSDPASESQG
jgi:hypothetical protein